MISQRIAAALLAVLVRGQRHAATIELTVNGLVCGFCAQGIEKTLRRNAATDDVFVSLENRLVAIATKPDTDIADEVLRKALKDAGYDVKAIARTERSLESLREQAEGKEMTSAHNRNVGVAATALLASSATLSAAYCRQCSFRSVQAPRSSDSSARFRS